MEGSGPTDSRAPVRCRRIRLLTNSISSPRALLLLVTVVGMFTGAGLYAVLSGHGEVAPPPLLHSPQEEVTGLRDDGVGFMLTYPVSWQRVDDPADPQDGVLLRVPPPGGEPAVTSRSAVSIKKVTLDEPVDETSVAAMRAVTDAVLSEPSAGLTVLTAGQVSVNGLPGLHYLYYFPGAEGQQGAHAHYFLFRGREMYILIFQALPAEDFEPLAPTFDAVAGTFRALGSG